MGDLVHKTMLVLDIEKFGPRLHLEQAEAQRVMYDFFRHVLAKADIEQTAAHVEDRGDGLFAVLDADVSKVGLIRSVITELPTRLYDYNRMASDSTKIRMRAAVHAGDVEITDKGVVGTPAIEVFRLLNSKKLYAQLEASDEPLVLAVTDAIHRGVIRHDYSGVRADRFYPIDADDKAPQVAAWIYSTTPAGTPPRTDSPAPQPKSPASQSPAPTATSGNFFSAGVTVQGDMVAGNKTVNGQ